MRQQKTIRISHVNIWLSKYIIVRRVLRIIVVDFKTPAYASVAAALISGITVFQLHIYGMVHGLGVGR